MELTLSVEEQDLLLNILEERHRELLKEIWHTDNHEFKKLLRGNEALLEAMVCRLKEKAAQEVHG